METIDCQQHTRLLERFVVLHHRRGHGLGIRRSASAAACSYPLGIINIMNRIFVSPKTIGSLRS